jgi:TonB family protein
MKTFALNYLLNSLWQAPLLFAAAWLAARAARRLGPAAEHRIWVSALILEAILPACSFDLSALFRALQQLLLRGPNPAGGAQITITTGPIYARPTLQLPPLLLTAIAIAYAATILYFAARLAWGLWQTTNLRRHAQPAALPNFRETNIAVTPGIDGPMTIGIRHRLLLLPAGWLETIPEEDLTAAIAHECAHIRRRDFAKNLLYEFLSLPIAYHPILRLTRSRVAESREVLCDAIAANATTGRQSYARSLLRLASKLSDPTPHSTHYAIGIFDANNFERRVMNLTQNTLEIRGLKRLALTAACIALVLATCASALTLHSNIPAPAPQPEASSATASAAPTQETGSITAAAATPISTPTPQAEASSKPARKHKPNDVIADNLIAEATPIAAPTPQTETPSAPADAAPMRVAGGVIAGNISTKVAPIYPPEARAAKIQGAVVLHAIIGKDGTVHSLNVVSGPAELQRAAIDAVRQWVYKPYLLNGNPTEVETNITVNFNIQGN